jgi:hypothetical protein
MRPQIDIAKTTFAQQTYKTIITELLPYSFHHSSSPQEMFPHPIHCQFSRSKFLNVL